VTGSIGGSHPENLQASARRHVPRALEEHAAGPARSQRIQVDRLHLGAGELARQQRSERTETLATRLLERLTWNRPVRMPPPEIFEVLWGSGSRDWE
jgi:hypothetical protein